MKDKSEWVNAEPDKEGKMLICKICGSSTIRFAGHIDGDGFRGNLYHCGNGHRIKEFFKEDRG